MQSLLTFLLALCVFLNLLFIVYLNIRRTSSKIVYYVVLCLAVVFYSLSYIQEIHADSTNMIAYALAIANLGISSIGPMFLLSIVSFFSPQKVKPWMGAVAAAHIAFVFIAVLTNPSHMLFYSEYNLAIADWTTFTPGKGPLYMYNQVVAVTCGIIALIFLIYKIITVSRQVAKDMALVYVGGIITFVAHLTNILPVAISVDLMPFASTITTTCFFIAIWRNRLYDVVPIASVYAVDKMQGGVIILDKEYSLEYYNHSALELFPVLKTLSFSAPIQADTNLPDELIPPYAEESLGKMFEITDDIRTIQCHINTVVYDDKKLGYSILCRDITDTIEQMKRLEKEAITDPLTGLFNRRYFYAMVRHLAASSVYRHTKTCLIMFDLDFFKRTNDTHGHAAGDQVLKDIGRIIKDTLRDDDLFARFGGEEFIVLLRNTKIEQAEKLAERMRKTIQEHVVHFNRQTIQITASFGVTEIVADESIDKAMHRVDQALYHAKDSGRNRVATIK